MAWQAAYRVAMEMLAPYLPDLALAYAAYLLATLSPGPANIAIVATAMREGRRAGLLTASGVVAGSLTWGTLAALGLTAMLSAYGELAVALRVLGGLYLLWLGFKAMRSALRPDTVPATERRAGARHVVRGLAIHLTNPKAIFAWIAIIAIGVTPGAPSWISFIIVAGCALTGVAIFCGYALIFSTQRMAGLYGSFRRWIDGVTAALFGFAGLKLLASQP